MIRKVSLGISGMSCAACSARIEKRLTKLEGVTRAAVNLAAERATVEFDDAIITDQDIEEAVRRLGYDVIEEEAAANNKVELAVTGMSCAACSAPSRRG